MNTYDSGTEEDELWVSDEETEFDDREGVNESTNTLRNSARSEEVIRAAETASCDEVDASCGVNQNKAAMKDNNRNVAPPGVVIPEVPDNEDEYSSDDDCGWGVDRSRTPAVIPVHSAQTAVKTVVPSSEVHNSRVSENCTNAEESDSDWDPRRQDYFDRNNIYGLNRNSVNYVTQNYQMKDEFNICKYYMTKSGCREGKHCLYQHVNPSERLYLDKDEQLVELYPRESFPFGSFVLIEVTALRSPDSFYGIPLGFVSFQKPDKISLASLLENNLDKSPQITELLQLSEEMGNHYSKPNVRTNQETYPATGTLVAFKDCTIFFRGRVLDTGIDDKLVIQCLDTGEVYESFPREDVYQLEYKFAMAPALSTHFSLANVEPHPNGWSTKFLKMFEELLYRKTFIAHIMDKDDYKDSTVVELITLHDNDEINVSEWLRNCQSAITLNDGCRTENETTFLESENTFVGEQLNQNTSRHSHETQHSFHSCYADLNQDETTSIPTADQNCSWSENNNQHKESAEEKCLTRHILDILKNEREEIHNSNEPEQSSVDGWFHIHGSNTASVSNDASTELTQPEPSLNDAKDGPSKHELNGSFSDTHSSGIPGNENRSCYGGDMDISLETSFNDAVMNSTFYSSKSGCEDDAVDASNEGPNSTIRVLTFNPSEVTTENDTDSNRQRSTKSTEVNDEEALQSVLSRESQASLTSSRRRCHVRNRRVPLVVREIRKLTNAIDNLTLSLQKHQNENN